MSLTPDDAEELVGRDDLLTALGELLERLAAGVGWSLLITGDAGVGKSAVLDRAFALSQRHQLDRVRLRADELAKDRPLWALSTLVPPAERSPLLSTTPRPALSEGWPEQEPARLRDLVVAAVEARAARVPLLLALDDAQWADAESLVAWRSMLRLVGQLPLGLLVTTRPDSRPELAALLDGQGALPSDLHRSWELPPLAEHESYALAGRMLGATPGPRLRTRIASAGGNPLYLRQLLELLVRDGDVETVSGTAETARAGLPPPLRVTLLRRVARLSPACRHTLQVLAVVGIPLDLGELAELSGATAFSLLPPVDEALQAGILHERDGRLVFRHDLVREAVYDDTPTAVRRALHREIARAAARMNLDPAVVARHFREGARPGDEEAVDWLERAAQLVAARSPAACAQLLEQALRIGVASRVRADRLTSRLAWAHTWSGRSTDGERLARSVLERPHAGELDLELRLTLAEALSQQKRLVEAVGQVDAAISYAEPGSVAQLRVLADSALLRASSGLDLALAADRAREALDGNREVQDPLADCVAHLAQLRLAWDEGRLGEAAACGRAAVDVAVRSGHTAALRRNPHALTALVTVHTAGPQTATTLLTAGRDLLGEHGATWASAGLDFALGVVAMVEGRWTDAEVLLASTVSIAEELDARLTAPEAECLLGWLALNSDRPQDASRHLARAHGAYSYADWLSALLREEKGDLVGACDAVRSVVTWDEPEAATDVLPYVGNRLFYCVDFVRIALAAKDRTLASLVVEVAEELARRSGCATTDALALRCRAHLAADPGACLDAARLCESVGRTVEASLSRAESAAILVRRGDLVAGRQLAAEVVEQLCGLGLPGLVRRLQRLLPGFAGGPAGRRRGRPTMGWEALTDTERTVVRMVAEGRSNPEIARLLFVSRRTVETHVSHALAKTGHRSRVQLATEALRRGWL